MTLPANIVNSSTFRHVGNVIIIRFPYLPSQVAFFFFQRDSMPENSRDTINTGSVGATCVLNRATNSTISESHIGCQRAGKLGDLFCSIICLDRILRQSEQGQIIFTRKEVRHGFQYRKELLLLSRKPVSFGYRESEEKASIWDTAKTGKFGRSSQLISSI